MTGLPNAQQWILILSSTVTYNKVCARNTLQDPMECSITKSATIYKALGYL